MIIIFNKFSNIYLISADISPFYAFEQSDGFGKFIALLLFFASIFAWTIIADKWLYTRNVEKTSLKLLTYYKKDNNPISLFIRLDDFTGPMFDISNALLISMAKICHTDRDKMLDKIANSGFPAELSDKDFAQIQAATESAVDDEIMKLEERLGILSSIVSASPFLGLLGTVWGVMMAFTGMAIEGTVDIKAIAPGISGALVTTVVGLIVAIPAVIGYNFLVNMVKKRAVSMDNFAEDLVCSVKAEQERLNRHG